MRIPDYFHVGLMKTGTTFLQQVLAEDKRIQSFKHSRILNTNNYYFDQYPAFNPGKKVIETDENIIDQKGNQYGLETTLTRIQKHQPKAIIAVTIREQRSLLKSGYKHLIRQTELSMDFIEFLQSSQGIAYLISADYHQLFQRIHRFFPKEQIVFIPFESNYNLEFIESFYSRVFQIPPPTLMPSGETHKNSGMSDQWIYTKNMLNKKYRFKKNARIGNLERRILFRVYRNRMRYSGPDAHKIAWPKNEFTNKLEEEWRISNRIIENNFSLGLRERGYLI